MITEPFLEAVPQVHVLLTLWVLNHKITYELNPELYIATFISSVLSATFGIAKFLKIGPCRLVPDEGLLGGHANISFPLLMLNILSTITAKGFLLTSMNTGLSGDEFDLFKAKDAVKVWILICFVPQIIFVSDYHICELRKKSN